MIRFVPQARWIALTMAAWPVMFMGFAASALKSSQPVDAPIAIVGWFACFCALAAIARWALTTCLQYVEIGDGEFRHLNYLRLIRTCVPLRSIERVTLRRGWGNRVEIAWAGGTDAIHLPPWENGLSSLSAWTWRDARNIVACLRDHGIAVSPDALLELDIALSNPVQDPSITTYWPTGHTGTAVGNVIRATLLIAPAAAVVWYNRGVPLDRWEAKAFWVIWLVVILFWTSCRFEYIEIGQGYLRRVGFFTLSDTRVPLASITDVTIRHGWLGAPRITIEWPDGRIEFAPIHLDPRLGLSRWSLYGIRHVIQRLRQERVPVQPDVLAEVGFTDPVQQGIE